MRKLLFAWYRIIEVLETLRTGIANRILVLLLKIELLHCYRSFHAIHSEVCYHMFLPLRADVAGVADAIGASTQFEHCGTGMAARRRRA